MPLFDPAMGHLLRRAGFGASVDEAPIWNAMSVTAAIDALVDYEQTPDDVDSHIGVPGYLGTVSEGPFTPHLNLGDAIQRWIFRMVHSQRPAAGEDGALLAQLLRHQLRQDRWPAGRRGRGPGTGRQARRAP